MERVDGGGGFRDFRPAGFRRWSFRVADQSSFQVRLFGPPPIQREARSLHGADMHEHVVAAVIRLNETVTLRCVESLNSAYSHSRSLDRR